MDFEALTREHKDAVYRQILRVCGNREDAEDVLVEALLRAWQHLDRLESEAAFRAWLAQIARRVCFRVRRREALLPLTGLDGEEVAAERENPEKQWVAEELKRLVQGALQVLPEMYREVYVLREIEELGGAEAAERLGITERAMKSRLHRARALLRARLDERLMAQEKGEDRDGSHD